MPIPSQPGPRSMMALTQSEVEIKRDAEELGPIGDLPTQPTEPADEGG